MSTRTTTKLTGLAAAMLVFLAFAPAAGAKQTRPFPAGGHSVAASPPQFSPDRADHLGTAAGPQPVRVVTLTASDSSGFDWADALIGAAVTFGLGMVAVAGVAFMRDRRSDVAISLASRSPAPARGAGGTHLIDSAHHARHWVATVPVCITPFVRRAGIPAG